MLRACQRFIDSFEARCGGSGYRLPVGKRDRELLAVLEPRLAARQRDPGFSNRKSTPLAFPATPCKLSLAKLCTPNDLEDACG